MVASCPSVLRLDDGVGSEPARHSLSTSSRHISWLEVGPAEGPLMIFVHGWAGLGLMWRGAMVYFAARGWRCIAPDMRGHGSSAQPDDISCYSLAEIVGDMLALHDALGAASAIWVGHDWGSAVVWSLARHHPGRCRGVVAFCLPYFAHGFVGRSVLPFIDRTLYPKERYPFGQWDYVLLYRQYFEHSANMLEADVSGTLSRIYSRAPRRIPGAVAFTAEFRSEGGWPASARYSAGPLLLPPVDFASFVSVFCQTGFRGANAWYLNDVDNAAYAASAPQGEDITTPVLFIHATEDMICDTTQSALAEPMRRDCKNLAETTLKGGHWIMLEQPVAAHEAMECWLAAL